jgi:hypothetical protein
MDFNVDPMSSVIAQKIGGRVHILDEIVLRRATTIDACAEFVERYSAHSAGVTVYGDASGNSAQTTGRTDYQIVREYFRVNYRGAVRYRVPKSNPSVRDRIMLVNALMRNAAGEVQLLIDSKCRELIKDFEQVTYKEDSSVIDKEKDRRRTHLSDALGYLLWQECRPLGTAGEQAERLV